MAFVEAKKIEIISFDVIKDFCHSYSQLDDGDDAGWNILTIEVSWSFIIELIKK